jgi:hypothetical protein
MTKLELFNLAKNLHKEWNNIKESSNKELIELKKQEIITFIKEHFEGSNEKYNLFILNYDRRIPKRNYLEKSIKDFKTNYVDLKMSNLDEEEFQAMKYFETLLYNKKYHRVGFTLEKKKKDVTEKYDITIQRLESIWKTRISYFNNATKIVEEIKKSSMSSKA